MDEEPKTCPFTYAPVQTQQSALAGASKGLAFVHGHCSPLCALFLPEEGGCSLASLGRAGKALGQMLAAKMHADDEDNRWSEGQ